MRLQDNRMLRVTDWFPLDSSHSIEVPSLKELFIFLYINGSAIHNG